MNALPTIDLVSRVRQRLAAADNRLAQISVEANYFGVRLIGTVDSYYLETLAVTTASHEAGVTRVEDLICVAKQPR